MTTDLTGVVYERDYRDETVKLLREGGDTVTVEVGEFFSEFKSWRKYSITETESAVFANKPFRRVTEESTVRNLSPGADFLNFAVTGDTHLGYANRVRDTDDEYEREAFAAFGRLVDRVVTEELDALLHVGDLFHTADVEPAEFERLEEQLQRLTRNGVGFGYVIGNHDPEERMRGLRGLDGVVYLGGGEVRAYGPLRIAGYDYDELSDLGTIPQETLASADLILAHPENADRLRQFCMRHEETCTVLVGHRHDYACYGNLDESMAVRPGTVSGVTHADERPVVSVHSCDNLVLGGKRQSLGSDG